MGLCNDVYSAVFCTKDIHMEFAGPVSCAYGTLGDNILSSSRKIFREDQRLFAVQELYGEIMRSQKTTELIVETD